MMHALVLMAATATVAATTADPGSTLRAWFLQAKPARASADFRIEYRTHTPGHDSSYGEEHAIVLGDLRGLSNDELFSSGTHVHFSVPRDAGTIVCDGWAKGGSGSGDFTITLNPAFARELERRGIGSPTPEQQEKFVIQDASYALLDTLRALGYEQPTLHQFTRVVEHGVTVAYLRSMRAAGFSTRSIDEIVRARDHGVDSEYVQGLRAAGMAGSLQDYVRARDHGVEADDARAYGSLGVNRLALDELIHLRDHGVTPSFVHAMQSLGYHPNADDLIRLQDHGVTADYVQRLRDHGYAKLSIDDLIRLRDHGRRRPG
jgi:hypothetical protein